ncbi:hypothetical protein PRO82_001460 [Candidatus Protochlamydia amoebophila]|nr:hypothetical protein [Candidatus Protochlamydia amoebophila]
MLIFNSTLLWHLKLIGKQKIPEESAIISRL